MHFFRVTYTLLIIEATSETNFRRTYRHTVRYILLLFSLCTSYSLVLVVCVGTFAYHSLLFLTFQYITQRKAQQFESKVIRISINFTFSCRHVSISLFKRRI